MLKDIYKKKKKKYYEEKEKRRKEGIDNSVMIRNFVMYSSSYRYILYHNCYVIVI